MSGISNLDQLLKLMSPTLQKGDYVFSIFKQSVLPEYFDAAVLSFKEAEGITLILPQIFADQFTIPYDSVWSWIFLAVHSDLNAVGFLAKITPALAAAGITVNVVSAYYHDHLFVPSTKAKQAMDILTNLSLIA